MPATIVDLAIETRATMRVVVTMTDDIATPINLTGATCTMDVRSQGDASQLLISLSTGNGRIVLSDPLNGELTLLISDTDTTPLRPGTYDYDLLCTLVGAPPQTIKPIQGTMTVSASVTDPQ